MRCTSSTARSTPTRNRISGRPTVFEETHSERIKARRSPGSQRELANMIWRPSLPSNPPSRTRLIGASALTALVPASSILDVNLAAR